MPAWAEVVAVAMALTATPANKSADSFITYLPCSIIDGRPTRRQSPSEQPAHTLQRKHRLSRLQLPSCNEASIFFFAATWLAAPGPQAGTRVNQSGPQP